MRLPRTAWTLAGIFATSLITAPTATAQLPADSVIKHVPGDNDVLIHRTADIPPLLRDALKRPTGCRLAEDHILRELPIITFQPASNYHPMTLVPCESYVIYSVTLLFERGLMEMPSLMKFPIMSRNVPSPSPGLLTWSAKTKELIGYQFTDLIGTPAYIHRHIYHHVGGTELNGFAQVRSERGEQTRHGGKNWQAVWEARPSPPR